MSLTGFDASGGRGLDGGRGLFWKQQDNITLKQQQSTIKQSKQFVSLKGN